MAFLRRREQGGEGDGQQPAEQSAAQPAEQQAAPPSAEPTPQEGGLGSAAQETTGYQPGGEQPPTEQPATEQPTYEQPAAPPQQPAGPAVTSEAPAARLSASEQAAAEDKAHHDARPDTSEDIPDNIWDQTRSGEDPYKWHSGTKRPHGSSDAIEFIDVKKSFGRNTILNGLNLGIPDDQISMILGPSGTGKSVCIKHMVGLLYPDEGDVLVHGQSVPNLGDDELFEMRKKFGVLFQDGALFGSMNLFDNVAFPLRQHTDKGEDEIHEICARRLREVGLSGAGDKMPNELSGGMRKRAGFARALVLDPEIVLFDEPDSGLDPVRTALLCELIKEIHAENGGAYVVITHDIMSARRVADYIAVLWKGRIVESGPASELFNSPNQFVRQFLSGEAQGPLGME
jgi:phospholipid/cholesterol/gamma-HCH transport system ATP-binding protein